MNSDLFIGLMSGTSLDAIDTALLSFENNNTRLLHTAEHAFPERLRNRLVSLINEPDSVNLDHLGEVNRELGNTYADAVNALLTAAGMSAESVAAIGCHGQTIRHQPDGDPGFSLQIGDAATLATATGISVVSDFRGADIALGGQGAPLVPAFHQFAFATPETDRAIVNIGGIANITVLPRSGEVGGYDTGPGNTLLDYWCEQHLGKRYDDSGDWAAEGTVIKMLLDTMLADSYFAQPAPKSTGREYFNAAWLQRYLDSISEACKPADIQATLTELTARSIADAVKQCGDKAEVYLCGGGASNALLAGHIAAHLSGQAVASTAELGLAPEWVEAAAFAWLARARLLKQPGNLPAVTGASREAVLGSVTVP